MGKIKTKLVKRTAESLVKKNVPVSDNFEENKKTLGNALPSKKLRNQVAGLLTRIKKQEQTKA